MHRGGFGLGATLGLAVVLLAAAPSPSVSPAAMHETAPAPSAMPLTAEKIYLRAIHAMKDEPLPAYVVFDEKVTARNVRIDCTPDGASLSIKHGDVAASYHVWFRVKDSAAVAQNLVTSERCDGALLVPAGSQIAALDAATATPQVSPAPAPAASAAEALPDTVPSAAGGASGPALIGAVRVEAARFYRITLQDEEPFEGHDVYRLKLEAYRDPNLHPLTEMLVDHDTFLVRRVSGEGSIHLVIASGRASGTLVFDREGPFWVVRDEDFELAFAALFVHGRSDVSVRGSGYSFADALPGVAFPTPSPAPSPKASTRAT